MPFSLAISTALLAMSGLAMAVPRTYPSYEPLALMRGKM